MSIIAEHNCFRPRLVRTREGRLFVGFTPGISPTSGKNIRRRVRHWRLGLRTSMSLEDIAQYINPIIRGWINYYGVYQRSSLGPVLRHINRHLLTWVKRKYKKRGLYTKRAKAWLESVAYYRPELFAHWQFGVGFTAG